MYSSNTDNVDLRTREYETKYFFHSKDTDIIHRDSIGEEQSDLSRGKKARKWKGQQVKERKSSD